MVGGNLADMVARGVLATQRIWGSLGSALRTNLASAWPQDTPLDPCSTLRPAENEVTPAVDLFTR